MSSINDIKGKSLSFVRKNSSFPLFYFWGCTVCEFPFQVEIAPKALLLLSSVEKKKGILNSPASGVWKQKVCRLKKMICNGVGEIMVCFLGLGFFSKRVGIQI